MTLSSDLLTGGVGSATKDLKPPLTAFGDLRVAELSPIFQYSFEYTVDNTELNINETTNGGTITQANAMAIVSSSTTTGSTAHLESKRQAKYRSGLGGLVRFTALFETGGVAATDQYMGIRDEDGSSVIFKNGFAIGYDGETFGFHRFQNDVQISVDLADWDDPLDGTGLSEMTIDLAKLNVWEIRFQYLGAGAATLWVESDTTGHFVLVHSIQYANSGTTPLIHMPNFHVTLAVDNKATTTDLVIKTGSFAYFVEGKTEPILIHQPQQSTGIQTKAAVTTEVALFTMRNKATYASKTNFIELELERLSGSLEASSANNLGSIRLIQNATLGGTPSYADINTTDSVVDLDIAGTTVTGGKELMSDALAGKNDRITENLLPYKFILAPGGTITVAGTSVNSATIKASLLWKELF